MGSVFSPTYFRARARQEIALPDDFCALNVALYRESGKSWAFTEHPQARVRRTPEAFELGGSRVSWEGDELVVQVEERTTGLGSPVRGTVRLRPRRHFDHPLALDPDERHHWWAVAPLSEIEVEMERPDFSFRGSGYHDTNFGHEPLESGFQDWNWSRAELPEGTAVLYDAIPRRGEPRARGLLFREDGEVEPFEAAERHQLQRTFWGMDRATRTDPETSPQVLRTLEDSPFYSRSLVDTTLGGRQVTAMHESLSLDRFEHPVVQRMIPFRLRRGWRA